MIGPNRRTKTRRGVMLLVVLVVVALMSIANLSYYDWTFAERKAADATTRQAKARATAESAIDLLRVYLAQDDSTIDQDGGWYENPARFRAMLVEDGIADELRTRAAVIAPRWGSLRQEGGRFGLEDDSGRLNLNTLLVTETREEGAGRAQLLRLPGMTEAIADAILDWIDEDDQPRSQGAERDYYSTLDTPLLPANGPLATIEQLLLVKGVTPELLWGPDQDRNHEVTESEAATVTLPADNASGALNGGWASLLTLYSSEANQQADGSPKINVNVDDLEQLHTDIEQVLGEEAANFVIAYRQGGPEEDEDDDPFGDDGAGDGGGSTGDDGSSDLGMEEKDADSIQIDFNAPAAVSIQDPLDLVGVTVRVVEQDQLVPTLVPSPWQEDDGSMASGLAALMDALTTTDAESIPGRVNINQAPRSVLAGLPGMPLGTVDAILANRDPAAGSTRPERRQATWLLTEGYVDLEAMRELAPYVTGQGAVFRAQVLGGFESGGPTTRMEIAIDTAGTMPRVVMRRDLSALGAGFATDVALRPEAAAGPIR
ncbi:MAG: hypothetical protein AAF266_04760 [Planctomycetota bacterium]